MSGIISVLDPVYLDRFAQRQVSPVDAIPTPLASWNRHCRDDGAGVGLAISWNVTIGATPGAGKSILGLNIGANAMLHGHKVGFVSLEMASEQLAARLYAILSGEPVARVEKGGFDKQSFDGIWAGISELRLTRGMPDFFTNEDPIVGVGAVLSVMDVMRGLGATLLIVDYIQLVADGDDENVYRETSVVANAMRRYAREHRVVVVGLSQLNRKTSSDHTQPPRISGLHGGMALEANSDQVVLLDHTAHQRDPAHPHLARTWLEIGKNRHGGVGAVPIEWDYQTLRVREAQPDEESLWPKRRGGL